MTIENASMEKCWDYFNPSKSEEEIQGSWVACIYASKIPHIFKKKQKNTEIICVKHLTANITGVNVVTSQFFYINTSCLDFMIFLFVVFLPKIKKPLSICVAFH